MAGQKYRNDNNWSYRAPNEVIPKRGESSRFEIQLSINSFILSELVDCSDLIFSCICYLFFFSHVLCLFKITTSHFHLSLFSFTLYHQVNLIFLWNQNFVNIFKKFNHLSTAFILELVGCFDLIFSCIYLFSLSHISYLSKWVLPTSICLAL